MDVAQHIAKRLIIALFVLLSWGVRAQLKISGKVVNQHGVALPFISVKLSADQKPGKITQTDSLGNYAISGLAAGAFELVFSSLNYKETKFVLNLKTDTIIHIQLADLANTLNDVEVNAKRNFIDRKIDRTVFNVDNSVIAIGTDALEILSKIPGVRVMNDKISLVGKGSVNVMINDKLVQLSADELSVYLSSIQSGNIDKIEVITNPPARYDAQGNSGLINIVLKKVAGDGFKGSVNAGFNQATFGTFYSGGNFSFRKNKLTLFSNLNIRKGSLVPLEQSNIYYPDQTWNIVNRDRNFRTIPGGQIGADYQISKKTVAGLSYNGGLTNFHSEENIKTHIYNTSASRLDSILNSDANAKIRSDYHSSNIYFRQNLDSLGKQITFNADWFRYRDEKSRNFDNITYLENGNVNPSSLAQYLSTSKQNVDLYTLKIDVDLPNRFFNFSLGSKITFINNQSDVSFYQSINNTFLLDAGQSNLFNYTENTQALYLNWSRSVKKWDFQLGLRGEYTQIDGISLLERNKTEYFKLFPTAFVVYKPNDKSVISLTYGRRINRPPYKKLNPFRWYSNQYAYAEGNPDLQPSYNNVVALSHQYRSFLTTTFSFENTSNGYNDVNFTEAISNIQVLKPVNFISAYHYQLSNAIIFNQLKWLESINEVDVFYMVSNSKIPQTLKRLGGYGAYLSTVNQFTLNKPKTWFADVSFWYQFPAVDGLNKNESQYNLDLGFKAMLLDKKMQLALNLTDILKSNGYRYSTIINQVGQDYNNYYDNRQLRITARYSFGNEKVKTSNRKNGIEEERKRNN